MQPNTIAALGSAVDDGELWIDGVLVAEGAPERCALRYEQLADQVDAQIETLGGAVSLPGFGGFDSGAALRGGFEGKAGDAIAALRNYANAARQMAQTFRSAAVAYQHADSEVAAALGATPVEVTGVSGA
ncbi:hypothetical protein [Nocardia flavorosea]|uniref:Excreted virulence factor EspC (Type VII ESX diderm) n=1 Tax=Nocardia flavorosea TaxID=53429 RepID=A0A846Y8D3_9NOCA|nr:hypothetical protein [Nocardia flavorosea]NKY55423.1 hypothetical protein [Nocardia flavorosea]